MVQPVILACILYAHHVPDILHDTDGPSVPGLVGADRADFLIGDHAALPAILSLVPEANDRVSEMMDILLWLAEQMQGKPQGTPLPHSRERTYRLHCVFKKLGRVFFRNIHFSSLLNQAMEVLACKDAMALRTDPHEYRRERACPKSSIPVASMIIFVPFSTRSSSPQW